MTREECPVPLALVTGASRGLGAEVACALTTHGIHVAAVARSSGALEEIDDRIRRSGGSATLVPLDLGDTEGIERLSEKVRNRFGRLDILVHAAADSLPFTPVRDIPADGLERLWRTNAYSARALIAAFEPMLTDSGGKARFVCDPNVGGAYRGAYAATKEALRALVTAWQAECPVIDIAIVDPPPMATELRRRGYPGENPAGLADPAEVALSIVQDLVKNGTLPNGS